MYFFQTIPVVQLIFLFAMTVHLSEAIIYLTFWRLLHNHDKRIASAIGHKEARRRFRNSAVSLVCEMYFYVVETLVTLICALAITFGSATTLDKLVLTWQFFFPVRNTIQALSTERTRSIFLQYIPKIFRQKQKRNTGVQKSTDNPKHFLSWLR